jgi:hypothetical protein
MVIKKQPLRSYMYEHIYPNQIEALVNKVSDNLKCGNISYKKDNANILCIYAKVKKTDFKDSYNTNFDPEVASRIISNTINTFVTELYQNDIDFRKYIESTFSNEIPAQEWISLHSILFISNSGIVHIRL